MGRSGGIELLGPVHGAGYRQGAALVRRSDGQMLQLGPLMYGLLECMDGRSGIEDLAGALSERVGRQLDETQVQVLAGKLAAQGLLAGTEHNAPPRRNPLLALRWKVLVTDTNVTRRLAAPFTVLFRPWVMWPVMAAFAVVFWFVLIHKGVASATTQAFHSPGLLILVFALAVVSAGFHELGHAAACKYGGAAPSGMGMGLYLVWPAFYTDVTDAYRLPKRARLRVDLAGLYFNAVVAVLTMAVWLFWRVDALLLLVAIQILQMVRQLSPIIRADGYHILSDATGIPDLYSHLGPTLRRLIPGHRREARALTGWARLLVTLWVLVVVPVLLSLMLGAVVLLPRLAATAWSSGRHILDAVPHQAAGGHVIHLAASLLRLLALIVPVAGSLMVSLMVLRTMLAKAKSWSAGHRGRRLALGAVGMGGVALLMWAWWPSGQYKPIRSHHGGTIPGLIHVISAPASSVRHDAAGTNPLGAGEAHLGLSPGRHLAVAMIPAGGVTRNHPAVFFVPGAKGKAPTAVVSPGNGSTAGPGAATAFPFALPSPPGPGGTQALALGTKDGGVTYKVAYALITVGGGAPVTDSNSAYALAHCKSCTTVAVSFQVVLVVGQSNTIAPIDAAGALNYDCPSCSTVAIADQIVVSLKSQPPQALTEQIQAALQQLHALPTLGASGTPAAISAQVSAVQTQIDSALQASGLVAGQSTTPLEAGTTPTVTSGTSPATTPAADSSPVSGTASTNTSTATSATTTGPPSTSTTTPTTTTTTGGSTSTAGTSSTTTGSSTTTTTTTAP